MKKFILIIGLLLSVHTFSQQPESIFIHFKFSKYELNSATRATLDSLTDSLDLSDHIELHGHCDAIGSDDYNIRLSEQRVKAVENYLLDNGWEKGDITIAKGHGEKMPLNNNTTDVYRSLNRRVEIRIIRGQNIQTTSTTILNPTPKTIKEQIGENKINVGDKLTLHNLHFLGGTHRFIESSFPVLEELLDAMKSYPTLVIRVEGHICCQPGSNDGIDIETGTYNLSEERAKAVIRFLLENGIVSNRMSYAGFGHSRPLHPFPENSEQQMQENRRVEIKIIRK